MLDLSAVCVRQDGLGFDLSSRILGRFTNVSDEDSVRLTFLTGEVNARDDVAVPPKITKKIRNDYGEDVLNSFKAIATFHE